MFCCSLLLGWQAVAQQEPQTHGYSLALVTSDSEHFPIGVAISSLIKLRLLPDHHIDLTTISTDAYTTNLELVLEDRAQFALMVGPLVDDLHAEFEDDGVLRALAAIGSSGVDDAKTPGRSDQGIGKSYFLAVRADVDEDVVYKMTKTIFDHLSQLQTIDENAKRVTLEDATIGLPVPIHEGALRYYREREVSMPALAEFFTSSSLERYELPADARASINDSTVGVLAADSSAADQMITDDLATVLEDEDGLRLISMASADSLNHLGDLIYREGVDLAIIPADLLTYARKKEIYPNVVDQVRYIATLFDAEVHVLVNESIKTIDDLKGKRVSFGIGDSTAALTAANVFDALNLPVVQRSLELEEAIVELKTGALSGVVIVGAKPLPELASLRPDDGLALLPIAQKDVTDAYEPAMIEANDYPGLLAPDQAVSTIAVPTVLATYNWQPGGERYAVVARFVVALFDRLLELKNKGRHPKWQIIDLTDELQGWERWHPAETWIKEIVDKKDALKKANRIRKGLDAIGLRSARNEIGREGEALLVD